MVYNIVKRKETLLRCVKYFSVALQILFEILSQVQSKLSEKCRKSKRYETISGKIFISLVSLVLIYLVIIVNIITIILF